MSRIKVIHGPNLNLLGKREPDIYGHQTLDELNAELKEMIIGQGHEVVFFQSNSEAEIVDCIQDCLNDGTAGVIINPAGLTHTSVIVADALACLSCPKIEVHLSNISAREDFRKTSITAAQCTGQISGLGKISYMAAAAALHKLLS